VYEIGQQRGRDRLILRGALPQPERDLHPVSGDPECDDVGVVRPRRA
jgi:hypothetical protein